MGELKLLDIFFFNCSMISTDALQVGFLLLSLLTIVYDYFEKNIGFKNNRFVFDFSSSSHNETIVLKRLTSLPATLVMSSPIRSGLGYACTYQAFMGIPGLIRQTIL